MGRLSRLAGLGVRAGVGLVRGRAGGEGAAKQAAEVLGTLRGLAAKMGQMASYVDGVVPEGQREAYEKALAALRDRAPTSSFPEVKAALEEELGAPLTELFASFDETPLASASMAQVHKAVLPDGRAVAVKVQHPGIARAVESDLANVGLLTSLGGALGGGRFEPGALLDVVRARFREELDYTLEAKNLLHFTRVHDGDHGVRLPALVPERSTGRVLTTSLVTGLSFEQAVAAPEALRGQWCEVLWRFVFRGNLVGGLFNADPHPGNYVFHEDGTVTFLDFGCCQPIEARRVKAARALHRAAVTGDEALFQERAHAMLGTPPGRLRAPLGAYMRLCFEPLFAPPYRITRTYAARLMEDFRAISRAALTTPKDEFLTMPPDMLFMNRLQFGFYSVLARLDAEVDYVASERIILDALSAEGG